MRSGKRHRPRLMSHGSAAHSRGRARVRGESCVKPLLTRDVGCGEIRLPYVPAIALFSTAFQRGRAPTTSHAQCSEGNYQGYIEDLKRRKGPDADQPHRVQYRKLVRA